MSYETAEADRRIGALLQIGTIIEVDENAATARVQMGDLTTPMIPVNALRAGGIQIWWMPTEGEQVMVGAPSGDLAQAAILASYYAGNAPSANGAEPMINLNGGRMHLIGDLIVAGDVIAQGVSLVHHTHGGVTPGAASTGEPN